MTPQCIGGIQVKKPIYKELVAASSRPMVLSILTGGESYGYEILKQVKLLANRGKGQLARDRASWMAVHGALQTSWRGGHV